MFSGFDMIAKTRENVPGVGKSMINPMSSLKYSKGKDSNGTKPTTGPNEKARLSQGLGSRGGLLTKKSTMKMLPKNESGKVLRMGGDRGVPNKVSVEEEPSAAADYGDGRDAEEKRRDEQRQERLDRIYELNKRLRQPGGNQERRRESDESAVGMLNFSSAFETSSTIGTISTASSTFLSTSSANLPTPKIDKERSNYTLDIQTQQANPKDIKELRNELAKVEGDLEEIDVIMTETETSEASFQRYSAQREKLLVKRSSLKTKIALAKESESENEAPTATKNEKKGKQDLTEASVKEEKERNGKDGEKENLGEEEKAEGSHKEDGAPSRVTNRNHDMQLCPEIPPGLQVLIQKLCQIQQQYLNQLVARPPMSGLPILDSIRRITFFSSYL